MFKKIFLIYSILILFSFVSFASGGDKHEADSVKKFGMGDLNNLIMHHVKDAHEWEILSYHNAAGEEVPVIVPLPIILIANGQIDVFMSSAFEENGKVTKGNNTYINHHGKIYLANDKGELTVEKNDKGEEKITSATPWDFSISKNVVSMLLACLIILAIFLTTAKICKKNNGRPRGVQSVMEPVILYIRDNVLRPSLGDKTEKFLPYLMTVFFFILFNDLLGIVPFFPGNANVTGNISVTLTLAFFTFIAINFNGSKHYWHHTFWMPGIPVFVKPILTIVEVMSIFIKPIALMIRLFANITAGHIIILSLVGLLFLFQWVMSPVSVIFVLFMDIIEILVAFLQAYIFTLLSAVFIGLAIDPGHDSKHKEVVHNA